MLGKSVLGSILEAGGSFKGSAYLKGGPSQNSIGGKGSRLLEDSDDETEK